MKKLLPFKLAGNILLVSFGLLFIFHILVLLGVVPSEILWSGQVGASSANLVTLELAALFITILFAVIVAVKMEYIKAGKWKGAVTVGLWVIFAYLLLNTLGNLASGVSAENLVFAPITLILSLCALRLAIEK